jgi:hypothetical protein
VQSFVIANLSTVKENLPDAAINSRPLYYLNGSFLRLPLDREGIMELNEYIESEAHRRLEEMMQEAEQKGKSLREIAISKGLYV